MNMKMNMRQSQIFLEAIVLTLGILSAGPGVRATEPMDSGTNRNTTGEPFEGASINLPPFRTNQNLTLAVESPDEAAQADQLAKQLSNPVASLISVPFQANEDWGFGPTGNGYKFTLNIQPVIPISISKDWNVIVRTIFPIVSQHDLFYLANLPKNSPVGGEGGWEDGVREAGEGFLFSPKKPG